jgi:hypothetical protein
MYVKYKIAPLFKIEFFKLKCCNFENKKKDIEQSLRRTAFREKRQANFSTNRHKKRNVTLQVKDVDIEMSLAYDLRDIFYHEFNLLEKKFHANVNVYDAWSVTYKKGDYHEPHNHGSTGYSGILYLDMHEQSPLTTYIQPWNNEKDKSVLCRPLVEEGDIVIVPQYLMHYTEPNPINFKKRIISFDFNLDHDFKFTI